VEVQIKITISIRESLFFGEIMLHTILLPINRRITSVAASIALTVFVAACGGGGGAPSAAAPVAAQQGQQAVPASQQLTGPQQPPGDGTQPTPTNATMARFNYPTGIVAAASGDVFVVDSDNHTIRRITQSGSVTTIAGAPGVPGSADGAGAAARFNHPHSIAIDGGGNLYVTDRGSHTIRRITLAGVVTTIAGTPGLRGSADGAGVTAQFNLPTGIAIDAFGTIYVADTENYLIRRITSTGSVSTLVGVRGVKGVRNGDAATALFANVLGLTADTAGDLFVTDGYVLPPEPNTISGSMIVRRITAGGVVTTRAGTFYPESSDKHVDGAGPDAKFYFSYGLAADGAGNLYVADTGNDAIRRVAADNTVTTLVGPAQGIRSPHGVTVDAAGNIYFTDSANHVIRRITPGGSMTTFAGAVGAQGFADVP
jgi:sugar lactone lactonase YvrE